MVCYVMRAEVEQMREKKEITEQRYQELKKEMDEHEKLHILLENEKKKGKVTVHA